MVDIKREDITLSDWTKGISADEFAWGSYHFSEWIQAWYSTKWFKLWNRLFTNILNYRENWQPVAWTPITPRGLVSFTKDGYIEAEEFWNGSLIRPWGANGWGAFVRLRSSYVNGTSYWKKAIGISESNIDLIDLWHFLDGAVELISNADFSDWDTWWTVGTWWTITENWAEHTPWNTWTIEASFTANLDTNYRGAIKISNCTKWDITFDVTTPFWTVSRSISWVENWWTTIYDRAWRNTETSWTWTLTITPSSDFDGTVEAVSLMEFYDWSTNVKYDYKTITTADTHPCIIWAWDLYIGGWNKIDIFHLADRWKTTKTIVNEYETIVDITQQAWNLIIWTTDGHNSKQYYWNWVDSVASECIDWKGLIIKAVTNTETVSYVLATSWATTWFVEWYQYRLYAVNWYQRQLLANKMWFPNSQLNIDQPQYHIQKRFDFNDVDSSKSMCMFLDSLYMPWCDALYKYGNDIPWLRSCWTRPIKYPVGATNVMVNQYWLYLFMSYFVDGINYTAKVDERRYTTNWYLVTEAIYWDKIWTRKAIEKLKIWYKNVASEDGNIKLYVMVDDDYFWRYTVSGVTTRPKVWDVYKVANQTKWEIIDIDKTNNLITFRTIENLWSYYGTWVSSLVKISWDGDATITATWYDNLCLIKTIQNSEQWYGADLIFGKNFVNNYMPYWHKMQLVIELNSIDNKLSPEVFEISMVSDITDVTL